MKPTRICSVHECDRSVYQRGWCSVHYGAYRRYGDPLATTKRHPLDLTARERILADVAEDQQTGCWVWTQKLHPSGYAYLHYGGARWRAHRLAFVAYVGRIPQGATVDHVCHNRACVNPDHLRLATVKQNVENRSGRRSDNQSGHPGVGRYKGKWRGRVSHNGREYAALFDTPEDAAAYARDLRNRLFTHNDIDRREAS